MESFLQDLSAFERIHQWWSPQTFQLLSNKTLAEFTRAKLAELPTLGPLLQTGTLEEFEAFIAAILEAAPKMITSVLACCLDRLYGIDCAQQPVSKPIVAWYRREGWSFPEFCHELPTQKIDEDESTRRATNLVYDA